MVTDGVRCHINPFLEPDAVHVFRGEVFAGSQRALSLALAFANAETRFAALDAALCGICHMPPPQMADDDDPAMPPPDVIEAFAKHCRCPSCCQNPPCAGVMAGGMCDEAECWCEGDCYADDAEDR